MSFLLWELAKHPKIQGRLREEIRSARAAHNDSPLTAVDLEGMPYLQAIVKVRRNRRSVHLGTNLSLHRNSSVSMPLSITSSVGLERTTFCHSMSPSKPSPEP